jgi:UDP-4-amino-4,6-dideoxy-N-acetyl-beta-L-altrosamine transaminase
MTAARNTPFLPYGRQSIDDDDVAAVVAALKSDFLTTGPLVQAFEKDLAARTGAREAVVCNSGTAALHLAAIGAGLTSGDSAIVSAMTFSGTANAVRYCGGEVVFADVDPETGLMGAGHLDEAMTRAKRAGHRPKAAFPVHINGQCMDPAGFAVAAARHDLKIIEDACHTLGGRYGKALEHTVGACDHSDFAVFSFHPVKAVTTGEGGAVTLKDPEVAERLRRVRAHGMARDPSLFRHPEAFHADGEDAPWYHELVELGFNYRATDISCALGLSQLAKLDRFCAERLRLAARYDARLGPLGPWVRPIGRTPDCQPAWHLYAVLIDFPGVGKSRSAVMRELRDRSIGTQVHYIPVPDHPYYRERYGSIDLPGTRAYYNRVLSLPLFVGMTDADVDRVVETLADILGRG